MVKIIGWIVAAWFAYSIISVGFCIIKQGGDDAKRMIGCFAFPFVIAIAVAVKYIKLNNHFNSLHMILFIALAIALIFALVIAYRKHTEFQEEARKNIQLKEKISKEVKAKEKELNAEKIYWKKEYEEQEARLAKEKENYIKEQEAIFIHKRQQLAKEHRHKEELIKKREALLEETLQGALLKRSASSYYDYKERDEWLFKQEQLLWEREEWLEKNIKSDLLKRSAALYADYKTLEVDVIEAYLKTKRNPIKEGSSTDEELKKLRATTREHTMLYKEMKYKWEYLMNIFPELEDYVDDDELTPTPPDYENLEGLQNDYDRAKHYVSKEEYERMPVNTRNQLALDRWWKQPCGVEEAGKRYELYCGYCFEKNGYKVEYHGIKEGKNDLGIDLIATKDGKTIIIQCKRRREDGKIHHNTICQLFGSFVWYADQKKLKLFEDATPVLMTSGELDETAKKMAEDLSIKVCHKPMGIYPIIKCNINNGNKIYHLPFDQQYNNTIIEPEKGEFYALTVEEATKAGFRRAFKHYIN